MIITGSIVFLSFISVLLFTLACYLTGYVLEIGANKFTRKRVYGFFDKLFFGFLLLTALYAIFITHGKTILMILPPVIIYLLLLKEKGSAEGEKIAKKNIIIFFTGVVFFSFLFYLQGYVSFNGDSIKYIAGDLSYYARIAHDLNVHHIENIRVERFYPETFGVEPYHYLDIWPAALISKLTGLNTHYSLVLVCLPFFTLLFAFGVLELLISIAGNKKIVYFLAFISILVSGLPFLSPSFFIHSDIYNSAISSFPKALLPGCILLFFINQYRLGRRNTAIVLTIACSVAFINIAPPLILAIGIVGLVSMFRREVLIKSFLPSFICVAVIAGYIFWFYNNGNSVAIASTVNWLSYIKTATAILIVTPVHLLFLLPLLIAIILIKRNNINLNRQLSEVVFFLPL